MFGWYRRWLEKLRRREEQRIQSKAAVDEFFAMSEGAKRLLSGRNRLSSTGYWHDLSAGWGKHFFGYDSGYDYYIGYDSEHVRSFAKSDYGKLLESSDENRFSAHNLKEMLFEQSRLREMARNYSFELGNITSAEWEMIAERYVAYIASFRKKELDFQKNVAYAKENSDRLFQRLAYVEKALEEIVSGDFANNSDSDTKWLESFNNESSEHRDLVVSGSGNFSAVSSVATENK